MKIADARKNYHRRLCEEIIRVNIKNNKEYPNFCDTSSRASVDISKNIIRVIGYPIEHGKKKEQTIGSLFEIITKDFIEECFSLLAHLRPGDWFYSTKMTEISKYEQYDHLQLIEHKIKNDKVLSSAMGRDYIIKPDIIVARRPVSDDEINKKEKILDEENGVPKFSPFRRANLTNPDLTILHASISCKWTIRSDRSQNTRTEALNLIRNRKGNLPHIMAVTAEPLPTRIAALALGTGDLDCVYHFALHELRQSVDELKNEDQKDILNIMINGKRLRDISDLPFDIAV